jgi:uncharacterized protein YjbJ (UPF0337 family)
LHLAPQPAAVQAASPEDRMNWDQIAGQWKQLEGQAKSKWAKLTDEDMKHLAGKKDALVGKIQQRYGIAKDEAEKQVSEWTAKLSAEPTKKI